MPYSMFAASIDSGAREENILHATFLYFLDEQSLQNTVSKYNRKIVGD